MTTEPDTGPMVSVVVPLFEGAPFIAEALRSILEQGYEPLEVIVVDDGSSDGGGDLAAAFGPPVRRVRQARGGTGSARNHGVRLATADLLGFLDADDRYAPGKLTRQVAILEADPQVDMVSGAVSEFVEEGLRPTDRAALRAPVRARPARLTGTILVRKEAFERVGFFAEGMRRGEGLDWFLRVDECGLTVRRMPEIVLMRRLHSSNTGIRERGQEGEYARILKAALDRRRARPS
jgi:glycosyltransferase involved in cell wall biosynthesis